ncbi:MAG TPA: hypothetical protein VM347_11415 [Nonomuraea sp.]|nr:hypothetical protein [Nonomuraea sp.]
MSADDAVRSIRLVTDGGTIVLDQYLISRWIVQPGGGFGDLGRRREPFHDGAGVDPISPRTAEPYGRHRGVVLVAAIRRNR